MSESSQPLLKLPQGDILGIKKESIYGDSFYSFEGIPYGKPPVGDLRFRAPLPADSWNGTVKDCRKVANEPMQRDYMTGEVLGSEDCLYVNVYAKTLTSEKPLPVMVWIYGGGFTINGATPERFGPDYFMMEDIILVQFNYRLCSLGFLSLSDPKQNVPGNAGLKDQVLALKWIKQNISHFNGDADNITLFGVSAGGASVHFMLATDQTRGLFNKAIVQSASILNNWANTPQSEMGYRLACHNGYTGSNVDSDVLTFLQQLEPDKLIDNGILSGEDRLGDRLFDFGPTIEPYESEHCVVPKSPLEMLRTAWGNRIPLMIGATSFEGLFMYPRVKNFPHLSARFKCQPEYLLPIAIRSQMDATSCAKKVKALQKAHFEGDNNPKEFNLQLLDYYSYSIFLHGIHRALKSRLADAGCAPTYHYRFDFDSETFNLYRKKFCGNDLVRGVAHGDDMCYLFFSKDAWKVNQNTREYKTIRRMIAMWTAFAKSSDPNCTEIQPVLFTPLNKLNPFKALNIGNEIVETELPEKEKLEIWNSLYSIDSLY